MKSMKTVVLLGVFLVIVTVVIAYSYMDNSLSVFGVTRMNYAKWDIHFDGLSISAVGDASYSKPTFFNTVVRDYDVSVQNPGDSVTFQFQVVNSGTNSAKLSDIVQSIPRCSSYVKKEADNVCQKLIYQIKNDDGTELEEGVVISPNSSKTVKLVVEYPRGSEGLKESVKIENLDIDLIFVRN